MERTLLLTVYFLLSYVCQAQQINWAISTYSDAPNYIPAKGMLCDNQGYLYRYGSRELGYNNNANTGSFLCKYSSSGQLIYSRSWEFPFAITKIIYDGSTYFYVAGSVAQATVISNILVPVRGSSDGFIGKMDLNGNFIWIKTFGANGADQCNGITFNTAQNKLVVTGGINDSLYMNATYIGKNAERSMLLASFDFSGNLITYKLIDFVPNKNQGNCGKEILADNAGNFLVFGVREGKPWGYDTVALPDEGHYVFKFNQSFNLIWSKFVINGSCYYGYDCGNMSVDNVGYTYISSFCSSKYGGSGCMKKIDATGSVTWSLNLKDAHGYIATPVNNNLFLSGEEGASIYPGPGSHSGYQVIKKFDHNHAVVGEVRMKDVHITCPAAYYNGVFYVTGYFNYENPLIGKDTLKSDMNYGSFIAQLSDVNCEPVTADTLAAPFYYPKNFCPQSKITLDAGPGYNDYLWSNGVTTRTMQTNKEGKYNVRVSQANGCKAYSMPIWVNSIKSEKIEVNLVTHDNALDRTMIKWHSWYPGSQYFKLYKIDNSDTALIAACDPTVTEIYDTLSHLNNSPVGYYLTRVDSCGTESEAGRVHRPIYLSSGANALQWTPYFLFYEDNYYLLRGTTKEDLQIFAQVPPSKTSYSLSIDTNYYYQVQVSWKNFPDFSTRSNIVKGSALGVGVLAKTTNESSLDIYPNPSSGIFNLNIASEQEIGQVKIRVANVMGSVVQNKTIDLKEKRSSTSIDMNGNGPGVYVVGIEMPGRASIQKRIVLK
jgi:hypothetical protein